MVLCVPRNCVLTLSSYTYFESIGSERIFVVTVSTPTTYFDPTTHGVGKR
jgi:hypothetical protein